MESKQDLIVSGLKLTFTEQKKLIKISNQKGIDEKKLIVNIVKTNFITPLRYQMKKMADKFPNHVEPEIVQISQRIKAKVGETQALLFILAKHNFTTNLKNKENSKHPVTRQSIPSRESRTKQYSVTNYELDIADLELIKVTAMILNVYETTLNTRIVSNWLETGGLNNEIQTDIKKELYKLAKETNTPYNKILNDALRSGAKKLRKNMWTDVYLTNS